MGRIREIQYDVVASDGSVIAARVYESVVHGLLQSHPGAEPHFHRPERSEELEATAHREFTSTQGLGVWSIRTPKDRTLGYVITGPDGRPRTMLRPDATQMEPRGAWAAMVDYEYELEVERDG